MRQDNLSMFYDTMAILEKGYYEKNGRRIDLKLSREQMQEVTVLLPGDVRAVCGRKDFAHVHVIGRCGYAVENMDSFSLARKRFEMLPEQDRKDRILWALALHPGP